MGCGDRAWHPLCLACARCEAPLLSAPFSLRGDRPWCLDCLRQVSARPCQACPAPIGEAGGQTMSGMCSGKTNILMTQFPARVASFVSGGSSGTRPASPAPTAWSTSRIGASMWPARREPAPVVLFSYSRSVSFKKYQRLSQFCCPSLYHFPMPLILINVFQSARVSVRVPLSFCACSHKCHC